jgi:hypothetical protein
VGMLADFFVATPAEALRYANRMEEPDDGESIRRLLEPLEYKGVTGLELGTLWAILDGVEWDVDKHMPEETFLGSDGESWLNRFPSDLTSLLAEASPDQLNKACDTWASTEEISCDPVALLPVLGELQGLAKRAVREDKSVYLWGCL